MSNKKGSYDLILKNSFLIGGAAVITMILTMIRNKFAAVMIGTTGIGLIASFGAVQILLITVAGLGIGGSAVRTIATCESDGNDEISRVAITLKRICWLSGLIGLISTVLLSSLLSRWTFGNEDHWQEMAGLGLVVLFGNIAAGHVAIINGMHRIEDLACINIYSALAGAIVSVALYKIYYLNGIIPAIILTSAFNLLFTFNFVRKLKIQHANISWKESLFSAKDLIKLGLVMMWTGTLTSFSMYFIVKIISESLSIEAVGIYSAAYALSGMFVNFVLNAMGADYYPRLAKLQQDKSSMILLVNEQTEIGLLLSATGLFATLTLADWIVRIFYTDDFLPAVLLIQWFILGCFGRVLSWPLGYVMIALGKSRWLFFTETLFVLFHICLITLLIDNYGVQGVAISFAILYFFHVIAMRVVAQHLIGFSWNRSNKETMIVLMSAMTLFFAIAAMFLRYKVLAGLLITFVIGIYCSRKLAMRLAKDHKIVKFLIQFKILKDL